MTKFSIALVAAALMFGCNSSDAPALKQTRDDATFTMKVNLVKPDAIEQLCANLGVKYVANGCSTFDQNTKVCDIYVMPQRFAHDTERLAIIGHETWHCRFGFWHD